MLRRTIGLLTIVGSLAIALPAIAQQVSGDTATVAASNSFSAELEELMESEGLSIEDAMVALIEQNPSQASDILSAAVSLFPESAQTILTAVASTDTISSDDARQIVADAGVEITPTESDSGIIADVDPIEVEEGSSEDSTTDSLIAALETGADASTLGETAAGPTGTAVAPPTAPVGGGAGGGGGGGGGVTASTN